MAGDQIVNDSVSPTAEQVIAKQVADKIWDDCRSGIACADKPAVSKIVTDDLDKAGADNPQASAFLIAMELDKEVSRRQTQITAAQPNVAGLRTATKAPEFTFAGKIHSVLDHRLEHLTPPPGWKPSCDCK